MICSLLSNDVKRHISWVCHYDYSKIANVATHALRFIFEMANKLTEWRGSPVALPIEVPQNAPQELILLINRLNRWQALGKRSEQRHDVCLKVLTCREQILLGHGTSLDLSNSNLKELPPIFDLSPFEQITHLDLANNRLDRFPDAIERLTDLLVLDVSCNGLRALPNMAAFTKLMELNIHYNYLESLPDELSSLQELSSLNASHNFLQALPESFYYFTQLTTLDLSYNILKEIADELGFLDNLTTLRLNDNHLRGVPNALKNLKHLSLLSLQNNLFQIRPEDLSYFPPTCTIMINGEKPQARKMPPFHSGPSAPPQEGPKICFSPYEDREGESVQQNVNEKISRLFSIAKKRGAAFPHLVLSGQKQTKSLFEWLNRLLPILSENASQAKQLARRVASYLKHAERNLPFQQFFFGHIQEATGNCDDRAIFPMLKIDIGYQLACIDKNNINQVAQFLLKTVWAIDLLDECAQRKCIQDHYADPIEVFMAYPIQLKKRLDLEIPLKSMKYFQSSHLTSQELREAKRLVLSRRNTPEAQCQFLKNQEAWQEALRIAYPKEYQQMEQENEQDSELYPVDLDSYLEVKKNAQIQTERKEKRIIHLTQIALREKCSSIN